MRPSSRQCRLGWLVGSRPMVTEPLQVRAFRHFVVPRARASWLDCWPDSKLEGHQAAQDRTRGFATRNSEASDWLSAGHGGVSPFGHVRVDSPMSSWRREHVYSASSVQRGTRSFCPKAP